MKQPHDNNIIT